MLMRLMICVCRCNYGEDEKNEKMLLGYQATSANSPGAP